MQHRAHLEYIVEPEESHWSIYFSHTHLGQYPTREAATRAAIKTARQVREHGNEVKVCVREEDGSLTVLSDAELK
jgi:hypothetical protein